MELRDVFAIEDLTPKFDYNQSTGNNLSRGELEDICNVFLGISVPAKGFKFVVKTADDKVFLVAYIKDWDLFAYEKLTTR